MITLLPDKNYFRELLRPWKLISFIIGMSWLFYGAATEGISDWDVGVSILMGSLTYLCAPWSVSTIINSTKLRKKYWFIHILISFAIAIFVVDSSYWIYHTLIGNTMYRIENFWASLTLYFLAGTIWLYRGSLKDLTTNLKKLMP